jgi:two-component sensor histidine kinase
MGCMAPIVARVPEPLRTLRLRVVRVAVVLGWASVGVVVAGTILPGPDQSVGGNLEAVWALAAAAAVANTFLAFLPWRRLVGRSRGEAILSAWAAALVVVVAALTYAGGGWTSDYYLLYFLVIPFIATTEPRHRQVVLYAALLVSYLAAVSLAPSEPFVDVLLVRLGVLAGACALAAVIADILTDNALSRERAEAEARVERALADEAHHRIKNNLQLVADLLSLEADTTDSELGGVVEDTLGRIQSVAAVHQALARRGEGRVTLRPIVERIVGLVVDRLGQGREVQIGGDDTELPADRATWTALVVNELVINALVHGTGPVGVGFASRDGILDLWVADEGPGPGDSEPGLGFVLIHRLVEEGMRGEVIMEGASVRIRVPIDVEEAAHARARR